MRVLRSGSVGSAWTRGGSTGWGGLDCVEGFRGEEGRRSIGEGATYAGVFGGFEGYRGIYISFAN